MLLYIHDQIDTARGGRRRNRLLREWALPGDDGLDVLGIVAIPEGGRPKPGCPLLPRNKKRDRAAAPMLDREAGRLHDTEKIVKVGGAFGESFIDGKPQLLLVRGLPLRPQPCPVMEKASLAVQLGIGDDGQIIFKANAVREPPHRTTRADEVPELPGTVQRGRIVINVIVDVCLVCVGCNEKGILALCPAHRRFIADAVRLLRCDLAGLERLADLIAKHIRVPPLLPACGSLVLGLAQKELGIGGHMVATIGRDQLAALGLVRVLPVVKPFFQGLRDGFALADFVLLIVSRGRRQPSFLLRDNLSRKTILSCYF